MKSAEVKTQLIWYLLYKRQCPAVSEATFGAGICDVLAIKEQKFVMEFEIKVTKPDLDSELNTIVEMYRGIPASKLAKPEKHRGLKFAFENKMMLFEDSWSPYLPKIERVVPNYYSFVVPKELALYAVEKLQGTPYGVIQIGKDYGTHSVDSGIYFAKKMKRIHDQDVLSQAIYRILFKGSEAHYERLLKNI